MNVSGSSQSMFSDHQREESNVRDEATNSSGNVRSMSSLVISANDRLKWDAIFKSADSDGDGYISGEQARELFSRTGLPISDLSRIWTLSDQNKDGKLDLEEFLIAMALISGRLKGLPIPDKVPVISSGPAQPVSSNVVKGSNNGVSTHAPTAPIRPISISPEEKKKYQDTFKKADVNGEHFISGEQARKLFIPSGLDNIILAKIWALADLDKDSRLSEQEFIIAMFLINQCLKGNTLPDTLPESLTASIGLSSTKVPPPKKTGNYDVNLQDIISSFSSSTSASSESANISTHSTDMKSSVFPSVTSTSTNSVGASSLATTDTPSFSVFPTSVPGSVGALKDSSAFPTQFSFEDHFEPSVSPTISSSSTVAKSLSLASEHTDSMSSVILQKQRQQEKLSNQLQEEQRSNARTSKELEETQQQAEELKKHVKILENELTEEKAKGIAMREKLKYVRLQLEGFEEQRKHFETLIKEKREQYAEEEELFKSLESEMQEKRIQLEKEQEEIASLSATIDSLKLNRREVKERLKATKQQLSDASLKKAELQAQQKASSMSKTSSSSSSSSSSSFSSSQVSPSVSRIAESVAVVEPSKNTTQVSKVIAGIGGGNSNAIVPRGTASQSTIPKLAIPNLEKEKTAENNTRNASSIQLPRQGSVKDKIKGMERLAQEGNSVSSLPTSPRSPNSSSNNSSNNSNSNNNGNNSNSNTSDSGNNIMNDEKALTREPDSSSSTGRASETTFAKAPEFSSSSDASDFGGFEASFDFNSASRADPLFGPLSLSNSTNSVQGPPSEIDGFEPLSFGTELSSPFDDNGAASFGELADTGASSFGSEDSFNFSSDAKKGDKPILENSQQEVDGDNNGTNEKRVKNQQPPKLPPKLPPKEKIVATSENSSKSAVGAFSQVESAFEMDFPSAADFDSGKDSFG